MTTPVEAEISLILSTHLGKRCGVSYSVHHILPFWMNFGHVSPHSFPGLTVNGEPALIDIEERPHFFVLFFRVATRAIPGGAGRSWCKGRGQGTVMQAPRSRGLTSLCPHILVVAMLTVSAVEGRTRARHGERMSQSPRVRTITISRGV